MKIPSKQGMDFHSEKRIRECCQQNGTDFGQASLC